MANSEPINSFMMEAVMLCKSIDWFLYDNGLHHERVNETDMIDNEVTHETIENTLLKLSIPLTVTKKARCEYLNTELYNWNITSPLIDSRLSTSTIDVTLQIKYPFGKIPY